MQRLEIKSQTMRQIFFGSASVIPVIIFFFCSLLFNTTSCFAGVKGTQRPYIIKNVKYYPIPNAAGFSQRGVASWYGNYFHGRRTSNGERYNMYHMTAAHKTLPMDTILLVTNQYNGRQVVVRVNDRGPFVRGRIIDLSYKAAQELGMANSGIAKVTIQAISKHKIINGKNGKLLYPDMNKGKFYVQIGAFLNKGNATRLEKRFITAGHQTRIVSSKVAKGTLYSVHIFAGKTLRKAKTYEREIIKYGYHDAFIVADS